MSGGNRCSITVTYEWLHLLFTKLLNVKSSKRLFNKRQLKCVIIAFAINGFGLCMFWYQWIRTE